MLLCTSAKSIVYWYANLILSCTFYMNCNMIFFTTYNQQMINLHSLNTCTTTYELGCLKCTPVRSTNITWIIMPLSRTGRIIYHRGLFRHSKLLKRRQSLYQSRNCTKHELTTAHSKHELTNSLNLSTPHCSAGVARQCIFWKCVVNRNIVLRKSMEHYNIRLLCKNYSI